MNRGPFCVHFCLKDLEETEICCLCMEEYRTVPLFTHITLSEDWWQIFSKIWKSKVFCCIFVVGISEIVIKPYM